MHLGFHLTRVHTFCELIVFKDEFGHCNVPSLYASNPSLGKWCMNLRSAFKKIQNGTKTDSDLSRERIDCLEEIGFKWQIVDHDETFEERCRELIVFKKEVGNCNVPSRYASNPSLGIWCMHLRKTFKKIQNGNKTDSNLSRERIDRLEKIGFQWQGVDHNETFEKRCRELIAFKEEFGHCNVTQKYACNPSLGKWCSTLRTTYNKNKLSHDRIDRLEKIGFKWKRDNKTRK
jgi:hypothetical protein